MTKTCPLVAISLFIPNTITKGGYRFPRAVGWIIETYPNGIRLVITAKHAIRDWTQPNCAPFVTLWQPGEHILLEPLGAPILDPDPQYDVAFLLVKDPLDNPMTPFSLCENSFPIPDETTLYNAKNETDAEEMASRVQIQLQSPVSECSQYYYRETGEKIELFIMRDHVTMQEELQQEGLLRHQLLHMQSRPGCSGSPVWDAELRVFGMNIRGSSPDSDPPAKGDLLVLLPMSALFHSRQRMQNEITSRLNKLLP